MSVMNQDISLVRSSSSVAAHGLYKHFVPSGLMNKILVYLCEPQGQDTSISSSLLFPFNLPTSPRLLT